MSECSCGEVKEIRKKKIVQKSDYSETVLIKIKKCQKKNQNYIIVVNGDVIEKVILDDNDPVFVKIKEQ